jgi:hypothetical protein
MPTVAGTSATVGVSEQGTIPVLTIVHAGTTVRSQNKRVVRSNDDLGASFAHAAVAVCPELIPALRCAPRYPATFAAQEARYGVAHGDADAFARGSAPYRAAPHHA